MIENQTEFEIIDDRVAQILSRKTDWERLQSVDANWRSARVILKAAIVTEHPDWSLSRIHQEMARRISNGATDHVQAQR